MFRTIVEAILLALIVCFLIAPFVSRADRPSFYDNGPALEQQKQDQERNEQQMFRQEQRMKDWYKTPC
jgi:hypothetical protein